MKYKVSKLAEEYAKNFAIKEINIKTPIFPTFNINAYNEYEYLCCLQEINKSFDQTNDLHITEAFLKGE